MTRPFALLIGLTVLAVGCGSHSDDTRNAGAVHVTTTRADNAALKDGDVRIDAPGGGIDLALIGDTISSGLAQSALAKAAQETDTSTVKGSGFGASIEKMVKRSVQKGLGTRVAFPLSDIKGASYADGKITFDWIGSHKTIFDRTKVNNKPLLESFSATDAQRFVDAVNARKSAVAR